MASIIKADTLQSTTANVFVLNSSGTEYARFDSSGNLGIGTASPNYKTEISATSATNGIGLRVTNSGSTGAGVDFLQSGVDNFSLTMPAGTGGLRFIASGSNERMRIDSSGNVGIGTSTPNKKLEVVSAGEIIRATSSTGANDQVISIKNNSGTADCSTNIFFADRYAATSYASSYIRGTTSGISALIFATGGTNFTNIYDAGAPTERMRIDTSGNLLVGKTATDITVAGVEALPAGRLFLTASATDLLSINRLTNDGTLVEFRQANTVEGSISVSGTTVSYTGGHLSRWAQTTTAKDESLVKGTVLSNLDAMNVYIDADGNPVDNEQLNKVKVSDVEGDVNVAGVFVNWSHDEDHDVDEINMAMTGDMIIRIAQGVTVARGDLLMSAGDGTAKPQGDDIVRSKTIAKVTSTHVTCTYADGSFCVPCVLMAC